MDAHPPTTDLSLLQRIYGIFSAPRVVFSYLAEKPKILGTLLVLIVLQGAGGFLVRDVVVEQQREQMEAQDGVTEEQIQSMESLVRIMSPVGMIVGTVFFSGRGQRDPSVCQQHPFGSIH